MNGDRAWVRVRSFIAPVATTMAVIGSALVPASTLGESGVDGSCRFDGIPDRQLTLARAVDLALCGNAEIRSAGAAIRIRAAQVGEARSQYWPTLTGSATELRESTQYPHSQVPATADTAVTLYGSLSWKLFDFGGRRADLHAASKLLEAAIGSREATVQRVLGNVVQAYFDAVTAKALLDSKAEDESLASQTLASAEHRVRQGDGALSDALQARTALARAALDSNRAKGAYEKSLAVLGYSVGLPSEARFEVSNTGADSPTSTDDKALAVWLEDARRRHPAIAAARADIEAATEQATSARSGGKPTIDLQANYYANGFPQQGLASTRQRNATVGIAITIPLFDGFLNRYKVREAEATVGMKEAILIDTERVTLTEIVKAYTDATTAVGNMRESQNLLEAALASQTSSKRRYDSGVADIIEVLTTQAALSDARQERVRSSADWRSARLRLLATSGLLSDLEH